MSREPEDVERETPDTRKGRPRLREVDDSASGRFTQPTDQAEEAWVPGVVEVEFKESPFSDLPPELFARPAEEKSIPASWSAGMRQTLEENRFVRWELSFPLSYPWSSESTEKALEFYRASGRDKFVTLYFPPEADPTDIARKLENLPEVVHATAAPKLAPPWSPFDEPLLGIDDQLATTVCEPGNCLENQWYVFRTRANKAWKKASGRGVIVADIDWGFNLLHQELDSPRVEFRYNTFTGQDGVIEGNRFDHGTATLGLIGAGVNSSGMSGFAFEASLWAIQAGSDTVEDHGFWVSAIDLVRSRDGHGRRKVMCLEIQTKRGGNVEMSLTIRKAIIDAISGGVVVCVPAGNAGQDAGIGDDGKAIPPTGSILVGATKYHPVENIRANSNGGCRVIVYAPGDEKHDLTCSVPGVNDYRNYFGGTSGAVAKVAGTVALLLQVDERLTHGEIGDILKRSETPVTDMSSQEIGVLLNAEQAVSEASRRCRPPPGVPSRD